ncbi:MAG TPA: pilus assembly protein TadG-related protein [Gemmatimonadota bacterium]|nr:pilus assembly protein TadG-related protein [Gemmatimonadota bacterium]
MRFHSGYVSVHREEGPCRGVIGNERGATIVVVALVLVALLGMAALAIDVGMLLTARTESQRTADAGALAGAGKYLEEYFLTFSSDDNAIRQEAQAFAGQNAIMGGQTTVEDSDVEIDHDEHTVRVWIRNTAARTSAIPTWFARVLGRDEADVVTAAAARVTGAAGGDCLLPVALPDEWIDDGNQQWDGPPQDTYIPWPEDGYTGYGTDDIGMRIQIKTQPSGGGPPQCQQQAGVFDACNALGPSWRCWWLDDRPSQGGGGGVDALDPRIRGCVGEGKEIGDLIWAASGSGNKQSLVQGPFKDLVDEEPDVVWDEGQGCPTRGGECVTDSNRIRRVPLIHPDEVQGNGANLNVPIANFAGVFVEKVSCSPNLPHGGGPPGQWNVYVRLMGFTGSNPIDRDDSLLKTIQLVE